MGHTWFLPLRNSQARRGDRHIKAAQYSQDSDRKEQDAEESEGFLEEVTPDLSLEE